MLNQGLFDDQEVPTQMGFFSFPSNLTLPSLGCHQSLKAFTSIPPSLASDAPSSNLSETLLSSATKQREDTTTDFRGSQLLSLHRSGANLW
jgi:hypothetical protein